MLHWHSWCLPQPCPGWEPVCWTIIRPYEIINRSVDLWLTDSSACGQVNFPKWLQQLLKYWWVDWGIGGVNIFSPSLVISISPFFSRPLSSPWCHTNARLLFHWAHWHGRFPPPQWCTGAYLNAPSFLCTTAEKQDETREKVDKQSLGSTFH